eukprot:CAMPEP_0194136750 /NCGR_PEP_ID=MMETSP0152-20130528/6748_1 /TAXON_ID=1049557 /ORGANISM="Thalassiothrix antarctica, Strain L6-D1" /LENGTH=75 /DNA_ID=CAMNT_0038833535 /DNA_START=147 /DNA_END=374 /DNA_ORIENTATION=+
MVPPRPINYNRQLYGPGPLGRRMGGIAAKPPLASLIITASQAIVFGLGCGFLYKWTMGDPHQKVFEEYYKENPPR